MHCQCPTFSKIKCFSQICEKQFGHFEGKIYEWRDSLFLQKIFTNPTQSSVPGKGIRADFADRIGNFGPQKTERQKCDWIGKNDLIGLIGFFRANILARCPSLTVIDI